MDTTKQAIEGYRSPVNSECPYIASSPAAIAWQAGRWLNATGRSNPRKVKMSRGYSVRVNDMLLKWIDGAQFERLS